MNESILTQLVLKDWRIMQTPVILYWIAGAGAIIVAILGTEILGVASFILFIAALAGAGIHTLMQTIVIERTDQNLPFIMSLPITVKEFTYAKMIVNLLIFGSVWFSLSLASLLIFVGADGMPRGTFPFFCILLLMVLVAYVSMLCVAMLSQTQGPTIVATVVGNLGAQLLLWFIGDLHAIRSVIGGPVAVWNSTSIGIIVAEVTVAVVLIIATVALQSRKQDFV